MWSPDFSNFRTDNFYQECKHARIHIILNMRRSVIFTKNARIFIIVQIAIIWLYIRYSGNERLLRSGGNLSKSGQLCTCMKKKCDIQFYYFYIFFTAVHNDLFWRHYTVLYLILDWMYRQVRGGTVKTDRFEKNETFCESRTILHGAFRDFNPISCTSHENDRQSVSCWND